MPDINLKEFERMRNGGDRTSVRVQPTGTAVSGYQVNLGNRPSLRDIGVVGAPTWTAEQSETWARTSVSATCPRRLTVFEGGKRDIDRCMEFGDDFDGTTLNTAKWINQSVGGSVSIGNSTLTATSSSGTNYAQFSSIPSFGSGCRLRLRLRDDYASTTGSWGFKTGGVNSFRFGTAFSTPGHYQTNSYVSTSASSDLGTGYTGYHIWEISRLPTPSHTFWIDGVAVTEITTQSSNVAVMLGFLAYSAPHVIYVDWVAVTKWVEYRPVAGTAQPSALNRSMCQSLSLADGLRACCA